MEIRGEEEFEMAIKSYLITDAWSLASSPTSVLPQK